MSLSLFLCSYVKQTFQATSWEMSIDFEVDMTSDLAAWGKADWQIHLLSHTPDAVAVKSFDMFGKSLLGDQLQGIVIRVDQRGKP